MPKPIVDRIASLREKQEKLLARLNNLQVKAKQEDRRRDTKRKIVVGGMVLTIMEKDPAFAAHIKQLLAQHVGRPADREAVADLLMPVPVIAANGDDVIYLSHRG